MKLSRFKNIILIISVLILFSENHIFAGNTYKQFTAQQCDSLIKVNETNPNFVILDVRTPGEWNNYHIEGSINRSTGLSDFTTQLDALPKHKIFLLHCQSGGRSAGAFAKMKDLEFAEVYEMIGGINSWRSAALPTTTITAPKLMLVSYDEIQGSGSDTINITITNRANGTLTFNASSFTDVHNITNNFNEAYNLEGASDYTFSIIHPSGYLENDSTNIKIESNGGSLEFDIIVNKGVIQGISDKNQFDIAFYPNPASKRIFFKTNAFNIEKVAIFNITGQEVLTKNWFSPTEGINISELKNGIYILRIESGRQAISKKLMVKH